MLLWIIIVFTVALFFAANIGASGTASTMGAAYGGGALKNRSIAVVLVAIFALLGANLGGSNVVQTISGGIVPDQRITLEISVIILFSACLVLFYANCLGIPLSTSEVTVGSIVGVGLALQEVYWQTVITIVLTWLFVPVISFILAFLFGKIFRRQEQKWLQRYPRLIPCLLTFILIIAGCYEAFAAGMNNIANAIGPLVGAGLIHVKDGILLGSIFLSAGAILMGGKVLETNAKKITRLSLVQGSVVSFTSGSLVFAASLFGIPVPLTQATTMAIIGVGSEKVGKSIFQNPVVKKIAKIWIISPIVSLLFSFILMQIALYQSLYFISMIILVVMLITLISYLFFKFKFTVKKGVFRP